MRVIGGTLGGRRLVTPRGQKTRPTSELVRGAIFNSLVARGVVQDASVADLFAGSGALGIEALSRGAREAVFVDSGRDATNAISANLSALGVAATVVTDKVERWASGQPRRPFDLILADPPYGWSGWQDLLEILVTFPAGFVVAEAERPIEHAAWEVVGVGHHGDTVVTQLAQRGAP